MSNFTYEHADTKTTLETYEWDNVWWEHTENQTAKRVCYIGDSISCGIRHIATGVSENNILFDGFGTSKALDNPFFDSSIAAFLAQQGHRDAVLFNNGLHGWHLSEEEYEVLYGQRIAFLSNSIGNTPVFIVLTTHVANDPERQKRVVARNEAALRVASAYGLPVIDLATKAFEISGLRIQDGVHFTDGGYTKLAEFIVSQIKDII